MLPLSVHVLHLLLDKAKNPKLYHVIAATLFYDLSEIPSVTKQRALERVWGEGNPLEAQVFIIFLHLLVLEYQAISSHLAYLRQAKCISP